jgi:hypothetical protein
MLAPGRRGQGSGPFLISDLWPLITRQKGCADGGAVARSQKPDIRYQNPAIPAFVESRKKTEPDIISDI